MLVGYSSSDSDIESENEAQEIPQRKGNSVRQINEQTRTSVQAPPLPALPTSFLDLYSVNVRSSPVDDPRLHGGRKRQIPHVEGNWNTHVYLEWHPTIAEVGLLHSLEDAIRASLTPVNGSTGDVSSTEDETNGNRLRPHYLTEFGNPAPLHISLSAPMALQTETRAPFLDSLRDHLRQASTADGAAVRSFRVKIRGIKWVSNADRSRWFLAAGIEIVHASTERDINISPDLELDGLLGVVNGVARSFGLAELYPTLHPHRPIQSDEIQKSTTSGRETSQDPLAQLTSLKRPEAINKQTPAQSPYHISLLWRLNPPPPSVNDHAQRQDQTSTTGIVLPVHKTDKIQHALMELERLVSITFSDIKVKIGNKVHSVRLET